MKKCKPKVLIEGEYFSISNCGCCKRVGMYYKNILLGFTDEHFHLFCKSINRIDFETCTSSMSACFRHLTCSKVNGLAFKACFRFLKRL